MREGDDVDQRSITISVNGKNFNETVSTRTTLADFLRHQLCLTGTHLGCEHGVCGACTVLVDGRSARSCLMLAVQADGVEIETIEGMTQPDGTPHPIQQSMIDHHGPQCGFCTPGVMMTTIEL